MENSEASACRIAGTQSNHDKIQFNNSSPVYEPMSEAFVDKHNALKDNKNAATQIGVNTRWLANSTKAEDYSAIHHFVCIMSVHYGIIKGKFDSYFTCTRLTKV